MGFRIHTALQDEHLLGTVVEGDTLSGGPQTPHISLLLSSYTGKRRVLTGRLPDVGRAQHAEKGFPRALAGPQEASSSVISGRSLLVTPDNHPSPQLQPLPEAEAPGEADLGRTVGVQGCAQGPPHTHPPPWGRRERRERKEGARPSTCSAVTDAPCDLGHLHHLLRLRFSLAVKHGVNCPSQGSRGG